MRLILSVFMFSLFFPQLFLPTAAGQTRMVATTTGRHEATIAMDRRSHHSGHRDLLRKHMIVASLGIGLMPIGIARTPGMRFLSKKV